MKKIKLVDIENARSEEQKMIMRKIIKNQEDPFDLQNISKYHKKKIFSYWNYWFVTENQWPYEGSAKSFLIISYQYYDSPSQMPCEAFEELIEVVNFLIRKFKIKGGALAMRFGDTSFSGASVKRIHFHLIQPQRGKVVFFHIGKSKIKNN